MLSASGNHDQLSACQRYVLIVDPHVRLSFADAQYFLNRMQMVRRTVPWITPLLEKAKLGRAICR